MKLLLIIVIGVAMWLTLSPTSKVAQISSQDLLQRTAGRMTDALKEEVKLTSDQIENFVDINSATASKLQQIAAKYTKGTSIERGGMVEETLSVMKAYESKLKQALRRQQWNRYQQNWSESVAQTITDLMTFQLGLSDQQVPFVKEINLAAISKMQGEVDSTEDTAASLDQDEAIQSNQDNEDQLLQKVLTPNQWIIYQENRQEMREVMRQRVQELKNK